MTRPRHHEKTLAPRAHGGSSARLRPTISTTGIGCSRTTWYGIISSTVALSCVKTSTSLYSTRYDALKFHVDSACMCHSARAVHLL